MKAFVTGSTGLLGSNLVRALVAQGHTVKALARSAEKARRQFAGLNVEIVGGDMTAIDEFAGQMRGSDVLFHTAAYFRESFGGGDHWQMLEQINVKGTIKLLEYAEQMGVRKAIYVSSSGVIGTHPGQVADESATPGEISMHNPYFRSKVLAEQAVAEFLKTSSLPVVLILPVGIFGPGDAAPTAFGRFILQYLAREVPSIPPGHLNVVDARDVANAMIAAVERGRSSERYIISHGEYAIAEFVEMLEKVSGVPAPKLRMSYPVALMFARLSELGARLTKSEPLVTVEAVRVLNLRGAVSMAKAARELGATTRPFEETLRDEVAWFRANGYVRESANAQPATV